MSEKSEAKRDGAKLQKNSGRGQYQKADALLENLSIDYKEVGKGFTVSRDEWRKTCRDAATNGTDYEPVIKVIIGEGNLKTRLAVISWSYLMHLIEVEKEYVRLMANDKDEGFDAR